MNIPIFVARAIQRTQQMLGVLTGGYTEFTRNDIKISEIAAPVRQKRFSLEASVTIHGSDGSISRNVLVNTQINFDEVGFAITAKLEVAGVEYSAQWNYLASQVIGNVIIQRVSLADPGLDARVMLPIIGTGQHDRQLVGKKLPSE